MSTLPFDPVAEARRQWEANGWGEAADGMAVVTSLMRAQQIVQARVDAELKPFGLTFARYELLMLLVLSRTGALPVTKASVRLQVHPTSVTSAVDRLQAAGLVERRPHPTDGRGTLVAVTDEGRAIALKATDRLNATVFSQPGLPPRKLQGLLTTLTALRRGAGDFGP